MPMNLVHRKLCSSQKWADGVAERMPGTLAGYQLGDRTLEIGPGFGATTRVLAERETELTALEIDPDSARRLRAEFAGKAEIVEGSGAEIPFPDNTFSSVVCFTMMHHVPTVGLQDAVLAEACRVLRPGGVFRGSDSQLSFAFRLLHIGDTMNVLDAGGLPGRLERAGFTDVRVEHIPRQLITFAGYKPARS